MRFPRLVTSHRLAGVVGVGVLGLLLWRAGPDQVWAALRTLSVPALLLTVALNAPITLVRNLRTRLVLKRLGHRVAWWSLTRTQLAGQTLSNLTPAAGGDLVRAWMWRRDDGVPGSDGVAAVVYERVLSLVLLLGAGAAFFAPTIAGPAATAAICAGAAALIAAPYTLARVAPARRAASKTLTLAARLPYLNTRTQPLRRMGQAVATLAADTPLLATFTATTLAVFVLSGLQVWLLATGLSTGANATQTTVAAATGIYGISQAGGSLSALPFGIGPSDAIVVGLLLRTGLPFGIGTSVALLLRGTVTLPIALAAAAAVAIGKRTGANATTGTQADDEPLDPLLPLPAPAWR